MESSSSPNSIAVSPAQKQKTLAIGGNKKSAKSNKSSKPSPAILVPTPEQVQTIRMQSMSSSCPITIADLPEEEKLKVSRLVDRLVSLGKENEELQSSISQERSRYAVEIDEARRHIDRNTQQWQTQLQQKDLVIEELMSKRSMSLSMLHMYQSKILELSRQVTNQRIIEEQLTTSSGRMSHEIRQLEALVKSQQSTFAMII